MNNDLWNQRSNNISVEPLILGILEKTIKTDDILRKRVHRIQCQNRWLNNCFNGDCPAFRVHSGNHYCIRKSNQT